MISVVILTNNSARTLAKTLDSIQKFDEVILLDSGSTDNTLEIAKTYPNVKVFLKKFISFGALRNEGAKLAKNNWILALDSDEIISSKLLDEIFNTTLNEKYTYEIPFLNYYRGKLVKCCGWQKEKHVRLYNKKTTSFDTAFVHEAIVTKKGKIISFQNPILHTSYQSMEDFLRKMQFYTSLFAEQNKGKKKSSFSKAILHGFGAFFKSYFLQKGIFNGSLGFMLSIYYANTAFYKYLKLLEINEKK